MCGCGSCCCNAQLIAATQEGRPQTCCCRSAPKQRSIHNNYMTFPLLFIMLSNHFSSLYGHHLRWGLLVLVMVGGSGVRALMNVRYDRKPWLAPALTMGGLTLLGLMLMTRLHAPMLAPASKEIGFARAQEIIVQGAALASQQSSDGCHVSGGSGGGAV